MTDNHQSDQNDFELELPLREAIRSVLDQPIDVTAVVRLKSKAMALSNLNTEARPRVSSTHHELTSRFTEQLADASHRLPSRRLSGSILLKSISVLAVAVVFVFAAIMMQSPPSAFADVVQQLRDARSFSYVKEIFKEDQTQPIRVKVLVAEDGRQRHENGPTTTIFDSSAMIRLVLIGQTKSALVYPARPQSVTSLPHPVTWLADLRSHSDKPDGELGKKTINNRLVEGYVAKKGTASYSVWVDAKTRELVQIEYDMLVKGSSISKLIMTEFQFHQPLDESLFSFSPPDDYKTPKNPLSAVPKVAGGETSVLEALRAFARRSDGSFPKSITDWSPFAVLFSTGSKNGQLDEEAAQAMAHLGSILPFLTALPKDDYQYLGSGKSTCDPRCIVFWYRNKEARLRAIYNDLSIVDISESDLPRPE